MKREVSAKFVVFEAEPEGSGKKGRDGATQQQQQLLNRKLNCWLDWVLNLPARSCAGFPLYCQGELAKQSVSQPESQSTDAESSVLRTLSV